jgi:Asp-tRNA(Asn)/Glu-tRNA(Gln) amidotransferase A subunit family amidase
MTTPPADPVQEAERLLIEKMKKAATVIYIAVEKSVADDISAMLTGAVALLASRQEEIERVKAGLIESVKLQSHYAELLNMHDGGQRIAFKDADEWIERLKEVKR